MVANVKKRHRTQGGVKSRILVGLAVLLVLSGCSDRSGLAQTTPLAPATAVHSAGLGGIQGRVVDDELAPVANASLTLLGTNQSATTDSLGSFAFSQLEPQTYLIQLTHPSFRTTSHGVDVLVDEVAQVQIMMQRLPPPVPRIDAGHTWVAYLACAVAVQAGAERRTQMCSEGTAVPQQVRSQAGNNVPLEEGWRTLLFELQWTQGSSSADRLRLRLDLPNATTGAYNAFFYPVEGPSPLKFRLDQDSYRALQEQGPPVGRMDRLKAVYYRVEPAPSSNGSPGVFLDQKVTVYATAAYNADLPAGYSRLA